MKPAVIMIPDNHEYIHQYAEALREQDVPVQMLPPFHYATPINFLKTRRWRQAGYNIVHVHWPYIFPIQWLMRRYISYARSLGYKTVWTIHNVPPHDYTQSDIDKMRWLWHHTDMHVMHHRDTQNRVKTYLNPDLVCRPEKVEVICRHPAFTGSYPNTVSQDRARWRMGFPRDDIIALNFGKIKPYKGCEVFAEAASALPDGYHGVIAGEVDDREIFRQVMSHQNDSLTIVPRYIPDDMVQYYLKAADMVVLPYKDITTSGVLMLAASFRRPVICTDTGGPSELINHGRNGWLISNPSAWDIREAIVSMSKLDTEKMGERAYREIAQKYTWEDLAEKTIQGYQEIV